MLLKELKQIVYSVTNTRSLKALKREHPFIEKYDLRKRKSWETLYRILMDMRYAKAIDTLTTPELADELKTALDEVWWLLIGRQTGVTLRVVDLLKYIGNCAKQVHRASTLDHQITTSNTMG
jgi:hypothetical protein